MTDNCSIIGKRERSLIILVVNQKIIIVSWWMKLLLGRYLS